MNIKLSLRDKRSLAIFVAASIAVFWFYSALIVGPLSRRLSNLGDRVKQGAQELQILERIASNEASLREQHMRLTDAVVSLRKLLPSESELPRIIEKLSSLAAQSNVKVQSIFPQRAGTPRVGLMETRTTAIDDATELNSVLKEVGIEIEAVGGYHQIGRFINRIESIKQPLQFRSLHITSHPVYPRRHNIKLVVHVFVELEDLSTEVPDQEI